MNLGLHEIKTTAEAEFIATKRLTSDIDTTLESQGIVNLSGLNGDLASITSLVGRLPVFDYLNHKGICYMRFKQDIVYA